MSGIIAFTGSRDAAPLLLDGLRRLAHRGYDSAGVCITSRKRLRTWKAAGKLIALDQLLPGAIKGTAGIGHTRWATHGAPSDANAHPHLDADERVAIVHNGIIENADTLRKQLAANGYACQSDTDSEVLALLLASELTNDGISLVAAMRTVLTRVTGTYGIAAIDRSQATTLVLARNGSPVIIGVGKGEMLAASDMTALLPHTDQIIHLDDGEIAELTPDSCSVTTLDARARDKIATVIDRPQQDYDKDGHAHFLHREIHDQAETVNRTLSGRLDQRFNTAHLGGLNLPPRDLQRITRIKLFGCGSAFYATQAGAHMIESLSRLPCSSETAAEFRYRNPVIERDTLYIAVSQSGETFDTLAALREVRRKGGFVLGIVNTVGSTIAREVDGGVYLHAGPEMSVATTKAYTSMLTVFALLALLIGRLRDVSPQRGAQLLQALQALPGQIAAVLQLETHIESVARQLSCANSAFYVGRAAGFPVALEGAQKLKEVSYVHAEAYPSSELRHGPLALITPDTPCVVTLQNDDLLASSLSTLAEINTRGAPVIALTDAPPGRIDEQTQHVIRVPTTEPLLQPILLGIPLQLLAYHVALQLGRNIDQPRNLAKSVTAEIDTGSGGLY